MVWRQRTTTGHEENFPNFFGFFSEAYSEPCQISKMEIFAKIVNGF